MKNILGTRFWLLPLYAMTIGSFGYGEFIEPGSCSQKCRHLNESVSIDSKVLSSSCSCSSSCSSYKDCCYDSQYRNSDQRPSSEMICLSLHGKARYKAVAQCSSDWKEVQFFCTEGIGHLPPVTSNKTGTTYANIHCAICNGDAEKLITWNVQLRCCAAHHRSDHTERRVIYRNGYLHSVITKQSVSAQKRCICKFFAPSNDHSFTESLELRRCEPRSVEISRCSSTYRNETVLKLCSSFLDPVYIGGNVYRNAFCAQCNYENLERARCKPAIIDQKISEGASRSDILRYCVENDLKDCIYFLNHLGRGGSYTFSTLMKINLRECVPENGKRCCDGEKYDFRSKKCKKLHTK